MKNKYLFPEINFSISKRPLQNVKRLFGTNILLNLSVLLSLLSVGSFLYWYLNDLNLSYLDSRAHLNIARRVMDNLKPGATQLGSVWLPLPHILMLPTIWIDFMWQSGLSGAIVSMISYVITSIMIFSFLRKLKIGMLGSIIGVLIFALNLNVLFLQSTSMTELLLICVMTAGVYRLIDWFNSDNLIYLIQSAFFIFLSTLIRYDGWFLFIMAVGLIGLRTLWKKGYKTAEGTVILFAVLAGFGILLWFLWNLAIYKDPLYFALGPYSARAQQIAIEASGLLITKGNILLSLQTYAYAVLYNSNLLVGFLGILGMVVFWLDKKVSLNTKIAAIALLSPIVFNITSLFFGHSVIYVEGVSGGWFNVRYGLMMAPAIAIFTGFLVDRLSSLRYLILGLLTFVMVFNVMNLDIVTLDDAVSGISGLDVDVEEASEALGNRVREETGLILISTAKHDAILFTSSLNQKRFIHEGTGLYWENSLARPEKWARWIVLRPNDMSDAVYKAMIKTDYKNKYNLVLDYKTADVYELKPEYLSGLITNPILKHK